jgi:hypothetical protein
VAARLGAVAQLAQQARLADPRLALDRDARRRARVQRLEGRVEPLEFGLASDGP